ncbi:hypothetical protein MCOR25_005194 [Pyricularia grisea]|nr:hypothetical protein MCOR25_005194 [Pyricularia grisea]
MAPIRKLRVLVLAPIAILLVFLWHRKQADVINDTMSSSPPSTTHRVSVDMFHQNPGLPDAALCRLHGWRPYQTPASGRPRKVYDLFMINTELEWLEIRLNTSYHEVDHFIVVEAPLTFTGLPKPLIIKENWERFAPYHDKLIYHELQYPPGYDPPRPWDREDLQRDAMLTQVFPGLEGGESRPQQGDVIIVADVDEVVRPETLRLLRACAFPRRLTLRSRFYYYSFEFLHRGPEWAHPQATTYAGSVDATIKPTNLRNGDGGPAPLIYFDKDDLWNAGWHCSSCYATMGEVLTKMASFSHVSLNQDFFRDRNRIADRVREGLDLWSRPGQIYDRIKDNTDLPPFVLNHKDRFVHLLDRSGKSAGFSDYPP